MRGIGSLLLIPLELDAPDAAPSLSMLELMASLFLPFEVLTCYVSVVNLF